MRKKIDPLKLGILNVNKTVVSRFRPTTVVDRFVSNQSNSTNFNDDGIYSTVTFGLQGSRERNATYSYIDLKVPHIHPTVFKMLTKSIAFYGRILRGEDYAVFDTKTKDFVPSNVDDGSTGYSFFIKHLPDLVVPDSGSSSRRMLINVINKYRDRLTMRYLIMIPAGIRDYRLDRSGRPSEDEINPLYIKTIFSSNIIPEKANADDPSLDTVRYNQQLNLRDIDEYINSIIFGKHKLINKKWARRRIFTGTRTVLTGMQHDTADLNSPAMIKPSDIIVGMYQFMKATINFVSYHVRNGFMSEVFTGDESHMYLVSKESLTRVPVDFDNELYKLFMTSSGINDVVKNYATEDNRTKILQYKDYYFGLIYKDFDKNEYMLLQDIHSLPEDLDQAKVSPLTMIELLYLSIHKYADNQPATVTRYPVLAIGGVYPGYAHLRTTENSRVMYELDDYGQRTGTIARHFPALTSGHFNSLSVHTRYLRGLGADFDGDTVSFNALFTEEAKAEVRKVLGSRNFYVGMNKKMVYSADTDISNLVLATITGYPTKELES